MGRDWQEQDRLLKVERGGTVARDPVLGLARYAISQGMDRSRAENLIGTPLDTASPTANLPALAGPLLFAQVLEDGLGRAPAIEVAERAPFSFFAGLERAVFLAPNARVALQTLSDCFAVFHDGLGAAFEETPNYSRFTFWFDGVEYDNGACNEVVLCMLVRTMRSIYGRFGDPVEARLRFDANGVRSAYDDFFRCKVTFNAADQAFSAVWKRSDLDAEHSGYDPDAFSIARDHLAEIAAFRRHDSADIDFLELISNADICAKLGLFNVAAVTTKAGLTIHRAQRIARLNGTSVGKIIERARVKVLFEELSRDPGISANELAIRLGYSDTGTFRRSVESWTGQKLSFLRNVGISDRLTLKKTD